MGRGVFLFPEKTRTHFDVLNQDPKKKLSLSKQPTNSHPNMRKQKKMLIHQIGQLRRVCRKRIHHNFQREKEMGRNYLCEIFRILVRHADIVNQDTNFQSFNLLRDAVVNFCALRKVNVDDFCFDVEPAFFQNKNKLENGTISSFIQFSYQFRWPRFEVYPEID